MARQDNPFAVLGDDDEGADVSVILAKIEAKMPAPPPMVAEQSKQKVPELSSKLPTATDYERGRGRGGRGRGSGRGGFGNVGDIDAAIEKPYNGYYRGFNGEPSGGRSRGRSSRGGVGRARGVTGFINRNQFDYDNIGGVEEGTESQEKVYYGERLTLRYESKNFVEEKHGKDGEEKHGNEGEDKEQSGFREYEGRENHGFRGYGLDLENRKFRDDVGHKESYGGDREKHGSRGFVGHEERNYGGDGENRGFRGGEGRGRAYGARGRRVGSEGEHGGVQYEPNGRWNSSETKEVTSNEKELIANSGYNGNGDSGSVDPNTAEEPKKEQHEELKPEQISSENKVLEEDKEMTLAEYEKLLQEKRKALESLKIESRKVVLDKDFEGMIIIEKKKEHDLTKERSDNDKGKKKEIIEREEKFRKSLSINEFLKPADGERYRGPASSRGRGGRGRGRGGYTSDYPNQASAPPLEDPSHFPILRPVAKA